MKILFDQGTPAPLRNALAAHTISTAYEMGWSDLKNGELLKRAEEMFDPFITTDKNLRYQQNLEHRRLAILILPSTSWLTIDAYLTQIIAAVGQLQQGDLCELSFL
jgi:hypothetical protein